MSTIFWLALIALAVVISFGVGFRFRTTPDESKDTANTTQISAWRNILDVIPDVAAVVDIDSNVIAASSNCVAMGLTVGNRLASVELRALNSEAHRQGKSLGHEASIKRSNTGLGDWDARLQVSPLDASTALVIAQDLSEERRLNEVRRDFVANVSHELKTPVGALSLLAEAIQAADGDTVI